MNLLIKMGKQIAKHKFLILLIGFLLLIPSLIGMVTTRVNIRALFLRFTARSASSWGYFPESAYNAS